MEEIIQFNQQSSVLQSAVEDYGKIVVVKVLNFLVE
jgi:hypothetical protein